VNSPANGVLEAPLDPRVMAPAALAGTRPLYWSIRRELWENRSLYIAPLITAAVFLFGYSISMLHLPRTMRAASAAGAAQLPAGLVMPFSMAASVIIVTGYIAGIFYCLDALYGERRDRSILFWKSLPVSDRTAVLAKAGIPLAVLPAISFAIGLATQLVMLLMASAVLLGNGFRAAPLWGHLLQITPVMFYGLIVHVLWHAPLWGWFLLVSSWARRTPFLWAFLPPLAVEVVAHVAFQSSFFGTFLKYRLLGALTAAFDVEPGREGHVTRLSQLDPLGFLATPGLWLGLIAAAAFVAAAVRLRRNREPV
jgi:ABC-2 type transport system permease protein